MTKTKPTQTTYPLTGGIKKIKIDKYNVCARVI